MILRDLTEGVFTIPGAEPARLYWKKRAGRVACMGRDVAILAEKGPAENLSPDTEIIPFKIDW